MGFKLPKKSIIHGTKGHKKAVEAAKASPAKGLMDNLQDGLSMAGMIPVIGNIADGANTLISGGRAASAKYRGDDKAAAKHAKNMAINATAMIPGIGQAATTAKLAAKGTKAIAKATKKGVKDATAKEGTKKVAGEGVKIAASETGDKIIDKKIQKKQVAKKEAPKKETPKKEAPKKSKPKTKPGAGVLASNKNKSKDKKGKGFKNPAEGIFSKNKA